MSKTYRRNDRTKRARAIKHGYRSGLEQEVAEQIRKVLNIEPEYEQSKIEYYIPRSVHTYTPDFVLPNGIIIETKGRFTREDRKKHELIKKQQPDLDIRFVFTNPNAKLDKRSKTSYAMWCDKKGFKWAGKLIPKEWFNEE